MNAEQMEKWFQEHSYYSRAIGGRVVTDIALRALFAGKVLVPVEPTHKIIVAMGESQAVDDQGIFPCMSDLLDFSGSNKTLTVLKAAYSAMLTASQEPEQ